MLTIDGLDVRHGLCVVLSGPASSMVFDCGTHGAPGRRRRPLAHRRLVERAPAGPAISTIALSHLHWDHYCGLLRPIPNLSDDLAIVLPRFPLIEPDPALASEFLARLVAFSPLDEQFGPIEIDLLLRIRQYSPAATPRPMSATETFVGADHRWDVLWPPRRLRLGDQGMRTLEHAIDAYDRAAQVAPWLNERLDAIRDSELYNTMLREMERSIESEPFDADEAEEFYEDDTIFTDSQSRKDRLKDAAKALSSAANLMSLVIVSDDAVLLTGDASKTATNHAVSSIDYNRVQWVQTPHHGGRNYAGGGIIGLDSRVRFSSSGPPHRRMVDQRYDDAPGLHHRTDQQGGLRTHLTEGRIRVLVVEHPS